MYECEPRNKQIGVALNSNEFKEQYFIQLVGTDRIKVTPLAQKKLGHKFAEIGVDIKTIKTGKEFIESYNTISANSPYAHWHIILKSRLFIKKVIRKVKTRFRF